MACRLSGAKSLPELMPVKWTGGILQLNTTILIQENEFEMSSAKRHDLTSAEFVIQTRL